MQGGPAAQTSTVQGDLVSRLAARTEALLSSHSRVLVGIDGPPAAGKTTLADRLCGHLEVPAVRASVDGFHHPRAVRRRRGELSAEGYYRDAFDTEVLVERLLRPFSAGAGRVATQVFDHVTDEPAVVESSVPTRAVLVVDGVFLLREPLREHWTLSVHVHVSPEETLRRARARDVGVLGDPADVERRYRERYLPADELYCAECGPAERACILVRNDDVAAPEIVRW